MTQGLRRASQEPLEASQDHQNRAAARARTVGCQSRGGGSRGTAGRSGQARQRAVMGDVLDEDAMGGRCRHHRAGRRVLAAALYASPLSFSWLLRSHHLLTQACRWRQVWMSVTSSQRLRSGPASPSTHPSRTASPVSAAELLLPAYFARKSQAKAVRQSSRRHSTASSARCSKDSRASSSTPEACPRRLSARR